MGISVPATVVCYKPQSREAVRPKPCSTLLEIPAAAASAVDSTPFHDACQSLLVFAVGRLAQVGPHDSPTVQLQRAHTGRHQAAPSLAIQHVRIPRRSRFW